MGWTDGENEKSQPAEGELIGEVMTSQPDKLATQRNKRILPNDQTKR